MAQTVVVNNGIPRIELEEVVIGSQLKLAVYFEKLISEAPVTFAAFDFTGYTIQADIKLNPAKDAIAAASFVCTPRVDAGWIDFYLAGTTTDDLLPKTYEASVKVWPTGQPEKGDTLLEISLPMKYKATR